MMIMDSKGQNVKIPICKPSAQKSTLSTAKTTELKDGTIDRTLTNKQLGTYLQKIPTISHTNKICQTSMPLK